MHHKQTTLLRVLMPALLACIVSPYAATADGSLGISMDRHAYYRGEVAAVTVDIQSPGSIHDAVLTASVGDYMVASEKIGELASGCEKMLRIPTGALKAGEYKLKVVLLDGKNAVETAYTPILIAKRPNPEELPVYLWPHQAFVDSVKKFNSKGRDILDWWYDKGLTSFTFAPDADGQRYFDYSLYRGMSAGISPIGGLRDIDLKSIDDPDALFKGAYRQDGTLANPFNPEVARRQDEANRKIMETVDKYPNLKFAFFNSEILDSLANNTNKGGVQAMQDILGFTESEIKSPNFIAPGVIDNNDKRYLFWKYVYTYGNGLSTANKRTADMIHRYRPDVVAMNDPYRTFAFLDAFPGMDAIGSWTYTNPDPKVMLFVETLRAACKPENKIPFNTVTLLNYPGELAPTKEWMMMGPGRLMVISWINLSRAPRVLSYYFSSACDPFSPRTDEDLTKVKQVSDFENPPSTFQALKTLSQKVIKPYGPMIRNLDLQPRRIAVLSSEVARLYGKSPALPGYYDNLQVYQLYSLLAMAHLQADVVFDETIERMGLDDYDVLVLPKCDVLTKSVYDKVVAFRNRGGTVIADQYLGPEIPGVIKFDFDFSYRDSVNANAIAKGERVMVKGDELKKEITEVQKGQGVTAMDDQKTMESYAARLKEGLRGKVEPDVDCDSPTALLNMLEKDGAKYLMVVNDKRDYDDRIGKYKAMLEKVVPQTVTITMKEWKSPNLYAYDMLDRKPLQITRVGATYQFRLNLTDLGGKIVALYPSRLSGIHISAPAQVKPGRSCALGVKIGASGGGALPGLQPVQVTVTDPKGQVSDVSDYYCARNGLLSLDFVPAVNDEKGTWKVTALDLTSGFRAEKTFIYGE